MAPMERLGAHLGGAGLAGSHLSAIGPTFALAAAPGYGFCLRIHLLMLGKTRRPELRAVLDDYVKRVSHHSPIEVVEVRDSAAALKRLDANRAATVVLLDADGKSHTSEEFARWLAELRDRGTRELFFVCGDADGFPDSLRQRAQQKLSLGAMTYSHELARVMLAEQLYRGFAILAGSPYPK